MKIVELNENTKKNLLEDLLRRSPDRYPQYEQTVAEIIREVREKRDEALFGSVFLQCGPGFHDIHNYLGKPDDRRELNRAVQFYNLNYITIALAKGRLAKKAMAMLGEIGITCEEMKEPDSRKLIFENAELGLKFFLAKASDVPTYVEYGAQFRRARAFFTDSQCQDRFERGRDCR